MSIPTYSDVTDLFTFDSGTRQQSPEKVTPHKVSLLILIFEFKQMCAMEQSDDTSLIEYERILSAKEKRDFMILMLELLQCPDMDLKTLRGIVDPVVKPTLLEALYDLLREISRIGVRPISDFFETNSTLLTTSDKACCVQKDSIVGLYIRRMELAYNEMSFSQIVETYKKIRRYYEAGYPERLEDHCEERLATKCEKKKNPLGLSQSSLTTSIRDEKSTLESLSGQSFFSRKQAEYFIANQALMLRHNEVKALAPDHLQEKVSRILSSNPDMAEAHFLSYINSLRVKEYCTAIHNLYHYFDCKACTPSDGNTSKKKTAPEEVASRYAALNLASLQFRFGNRDECKATLQEAIQKAQESNDQVCLQHALMWMNLLDESIVPANQLERAIRKTRDLSLPDLYVLGYNSLSHRLGNGPETPSRVIQMFTESTLINCLNSNYAMMSSGFAQLASLWSQYGKRELCSLNSQVVLNLNTSINAVFFSGRSVCIAMCHLAEQHANMGQYTLAMEILTQAKSQFPANTSDACVWQSTQQQINFDRAVHNCRLNDAEQALIDLLAVDEEEARIRKPVLLKEKGEITKAFDCLNELLKDCDVVTSCDCADKKCRILLQLADLFLCTDNASSAVLHITECIALSKRHHLETHKALATAYLGLVQLRLQVPQHGVRLIESQLIKILTHASCYDKARVLFVYAKCKAAGASHMTNQSDQTAELVSALDLMTSALKLFTEAEAHMREKEVVYTQSLLYHQLGNTDSRNKCAYRFKKLDKLYPTLSSVCLNGM